MDLRMELKLLTDMRIISSSTSFAAFSASNAKKKKDAEDFQAFDFFFGMDVTEWALSCHVCRRENERNDCYSKQEEAPA